MNSQIIPINLQSKESRTALTKMMMNLFGLWRISIADQSILLNRSLGTIRHYQNGGRFGNNKDMLDRAVYLLSIHKSLRILFPHNKDLVYQWVTANNLAFNGQPPIDVMKNGLEGINTVRIYLESQIYL